LIGKDAPRDRAVLPSVAWLRGEKSPAALRVHGRGVDFLQTIRAVHPGTALANSKLI